MNNMIDDVIFTRFLLVLFGVGRIRWYSDKNYASREMSGVIHSHSTTRRYFYF